MTTFREGGRPYAAAPFAPGFICTAFFPALDLPLSREQAITELVVAYFDRHGPATIRDASRWSGFSAANIAAALNACGRPVATVVTPWSSSPCLMFADQAEECAGKDRVCTDFLSDAISDRHKARVPSPRRKHVLFQNGRGGFAGTRCDSDDIIDVVSRWSRGFIVRVFEGVACPPDPAE